jgi:glyoxylase-like metal-dependent hydrolase (beta-lactamase superfamily II)
MSKQWLSGFLCVAVVGAAAWFGGAGEQGKPAASAWVEVHPGVLRTATLPAGYALVDGDVALLVDAPQDAGGLTAHGVKTIDGVLLTHHHRDTCAAVERFLAEKVPVRAPNASAEWLTPANVRQYWQTSLPLRSSRAAYLVVPVGFEGVDCSLVNDQVIAWHGWTIRVMETPGHSRDHVAFLAQKGKNGPLLAFCGDALASPGKLWTPYTTDWDHWTDAGLTPTARSLRQLAGRKPDLLLPAHGTPITKNAVAALEQTATAVEELAFLKSFERYTKQRLGNAPAYAFLAREQAESRGEKAWSQISEHLFLTGNTYVLTSKTKAFLVLDPWGKLSADQIARLGKDNGLGPLEVVMFSHAHWDHYDGIYHLPDREKFQVWTLDQVAPPIAEPFRWHAPFLDARPVTFDRRVKDGESAAWREYRFHFHHLPGQSVFTMGVEAPIDGKKCYFTADNFFHQDQFSGTGGWMGLNRSYPLPYAASAQKVLDAAPDWVLAEHGGPFEFNAEDFRRRVEWGKVSAKAAGALCPSGHHRRDWNPNRLHVEPLVQKARPGALVRWTLEAENVLARKETLHVRLEGRGLIPDQTMDLEVAGGQTATKELAFRLRETSTPGRHIVVLRTMAGNEPEGSDAFIGVDIEP